MAYTNNSGQVRIGVRSPGVAAIVTTSTLLTSLYSVWNGDTTTSTLDSSIYGAWNGENNANDSVGTNHGTLMNGTTFTTGKLGKAFTFDGVNDYIEFPSNTMNLTGDFTISFWVNLSSLTGHQFFISNVVNQSSLYRGFAIVKNNTTNLINVQFYNSNSSVDVFSSSAMVANTWYNIVLTRKSGVSTKLYVNGVLSGSNTSTMDPNYYTSQACQIGGYNNTASPATYFTNGNIDSLTTWNKAISQDEVTQLYNLGTGTQYPFSGQTLPSANNQFAIDNGTLMSGCTFTDGKIGKAFTFDGVNDYVSLPNNSLNFTGDFSVSAWVYVPTTLTGANSIYIINNMSCDSWFSNPFGWRFLVYGNTLHFGIFNHTNTYYAISVEYVFIPVSNVSPGGWYHLAATRKASTGTKLFINGNMVGSNSNTVNPTYNLTVDDIRPTIGNLYMGVNGSKQISYFAPAGTKIDGLSVWQKELTSTEITELYNSGNGKQLTVATPIVTNGLVLNLDASRLSSYPNAGTTWTDISGNGNNGTMVNGPIFGTANGGQITFDGTDDYVSIPDINVTNQISIEAWVYANSVGAYNAIASQWRAETNSVSSWTLETVGSDIRLYITNGTTISFASTTFQTGTWTHIIGTYDTSTIKIYKNNVLGSTTGTIATINNSNLNINIGALYSSAGVQGGGGRWNGRISNIKIYNKALSATEVTQNFNATKSRFGL